MPNLIKLYYSRKLWYAETEGRPDQPILVARGITWETALNLLVDKMRKERWAPDATWKPWT